MTRPPLGFIPEPITLALDRILPSRKPPEGLPTSRKFKQIMASMEAVGLIEPLSVGKADKSTGQHILLDGHIRLLALQQLGYTDAPCLIATDDESYTYNNRINRITSIQEHQMLRRAVERGVTPDRLAKALNVDVSQIHKKVSLLEGICPEAIEMLKDQHFSANLGAVLRKMKPTRQVECVELMLTANNMTVAYAEALLAARQAFQADGAQSPELRAALAAAEVAFAEMAVVAAHVTLGFVLIAASATLFVLALRRPVSN